VGVVARFKTTDIFRKMSPDVTIGEWHTQPCGAKPYISLQDRLRSPVRAKCAAVVKLFPPLYRTCKTVRSRMLGNNRERT
jgi:hypothetical protein